MVADHMPELELGADMARASIAGEADAELARTNLPLVLEGDPDIFALDPFPRAVLEMLHERGALRVLHRPDEVALAAVVVLGGVVGNDALSLHVGLPCEYKDLDGLVGCAGSGAETSNSKKAGEDVKAGTCHVDFLVHFSE